MDSTPKDVVGNLTNCEMYSIGTYNDIPISK